MREMPDDVFDLAVVDPMYGIGWKNIVGSGRAKLAKVNKYKSLEDKPPSKDYFEQLFRVSKNQIIWGAQHFMTDICRNSPHWIVWDKLNGATDFADCELAWTSFPGSVKKFEFLWSGMRQGAQGRNHEYRIHPCQKPVALYRWIFKNYAEPGMKILDTHLGSGSSRIAAYDYDLDFTGYEISKHYFDLQEQRFKEYTSQIRLEV